MARITNSHDWEALRTEPPAGLSALQSAELDRFLDLGFPTERSEHWRWTPTGKLADIASAALRQPAAQVNAPMRLVDKALGEHPVLATIPAAQRIVFYNGERLAADTEPSLTAIATSSAALDADNSALAALNGMHASATLRIDVSAAWTGDTLHIVHIVDATDALPAPRLALSLGTNSALEIVEHVIQVQSGTLFQNALVSVQLEADATLSWRRLQTLGVDAHSVAEFRVAMAERSTFNLFTFDSGAALARNDVNVSLNGQEAAANLAGIFLCNGSQHIDNRLNVVHAHPGASSSQEYAGIAGGQSKSVYHGKVTVAKGADGTDAKQRNRNLLLERTAEVFTKPELEIYADDVRCAHGATTGELDADALYYLMARGLTNDTARRLLIEAFVAKTLAVIEDPTLATHVSELLQRKLTTMLEESDL